MFFFSYFFLNRAVTAAKRVFFWERVLSGRGPEEEKEETKGHKLSTW